MFLRKRAAGALPPPNAAVLMLVDRCGEAARAAADLHGAIDVVLRGVADATGWAAAHAWVPAGIPGLWVSSGLWYADDGIALGGLRRACEEAAPAAVRGHLALALHRESAQWTGHLGGLAGTGRDDAAARAGVVAAIGCPVYSARQPRALLEWYHVDDRRPASDIAYALAHLSAVLTEVAERTVVRYAAGPGRIPSVREALDWVTEDGAVLAC